MKKNRLYLELYHGRNNPDQDMDGWGFQGPVIGPFNMYTITYLNILRLLYNGNGYTIPLETDMLAVDGKYYGDWAIHGRKPKDSQIKTFKTIPQAIEAGWLEQF